MARVSNGEVKIKNVVVREARAVVNRLHLSEKSGHRWIIIESSLDSLKSKIAADPDYKRVAHDWIHFDGL